MAKAKRDIHRHEMILQIIPAPDDCYAVFAWWDEHENGRESVRPAFQRVPCFALMARCQKQYEDEEGPCVADTWQEPCTERDCGVDPIENSTNYKFLGLHYDSASKEDATDWQSLAVREYERELAARAKKAG